MRRPVDAPYTITTEHGENVGNLARFGRHSGVDYGLGADRQVLAPAKARVSFAAWDPTGGNMVILYDGQFYHRLMHNNRLHVTVGQDVNEGQHIADSGSTGLSSGVHVHWDISRKYRAESFDDFIPPADWLAGTYAPTPAPAPAPAPDVMQPYQRRVASFGVNRRASPSISGVVLGEFPANDILDFKGYVKAEPYAGNDIWYVGRYSDTYFWSGAFTDASTTGLIDLTPKPIPPLSPPATPVTPPANPPVIPPVGYVFDKDVMCVTEVIPAATTNFQRGNFPNRPEAVVLHDFGTKNVNTVGSVINYFTGQNVEISAHFVVSGKRVIQMVSLKDRAWHAGPAGNDFIGIEIDPVQDQDTIESTRSLLRDLKAKYGYQLRLVEHNQLAKTLCGDDIDLKNYDVPEVAQPDRLTAIEGKVDGVISFLQKTFKEFK
jgi:murein DD-endopeptidase MepM/ murein hydrolase activator NlpD